MAKQPVTYSTGKSKQPVWPIFFGLGALILIWAGYLIFHIPDWLGIGLGFISGVAFVSIIIDYIYDLPPLLRGSRQGDER